MAAIVVDLTPRQIEVCVLAGCSGYWMSNKAIARELDISVHTVNRHLRDGADRILACHPEIGGGPPRRICQAWLRIAYHRVAARAVA